MYAGGHAKVRPYAGKVNKLGPSGGNFFTSLN
jgi:hypothetical protein